MSVFLVQKNSSHRNLLQLHTYAKYYILSLTFIEEFKNLESLFVDYYSSDEHFDTLTQLWAKATSAKTDEERAKAITHIFLPAVHIE